ncbi:MAG: CRISPR-associated endonuclease Cas9 [Bacteroidetes bacterium ADurb.Bin408]|nr:MAG: CRISPR-associated endonuclease Cas9 [Bacteroidetes bacterium ADurb.Bin408]
MCDNKFNRSIKKNKIPSQLENHKEILGRIEFWKEKIEQLEEEIERAIRQSKMAADKDSKDRAIQKRHRLVFERNYWRGKYARFTMDDVPEGFKNSQLVDIGIITKYSKIYLNTLFEKVYTVKGSIVADFRVMWGIQDEFVKKERINHIHHCVDAIVIACINKENYEKLAAYYHEQEQKWLKNDHSKPAFNKPWETFAEDMKEIEKEVFVSHYTPDVLHKQTKRKLRKRGKIIMKNGRPVYLQGDTVRGSLHKDTFYGAIERPVLNKDGIEEKQIKYVVRKSLINIKASEIEKIVDDKVKEVVARAVEEKILIISASDGQLNKINGKIWLNEQKGVEVKKVRIYQPMVTNPIHLKKQRDKSLLKPKPYKEHYHVMNDGNYLMAIYEGLDKKGKIKRDFEIRSKLEAGEYYKLSVKKFINQQDVSPNEGLLPLVKSANNIEMPLKAIIKIGTMVILWEKSPEEVWDLSISDINKRIYKIIGLSNQRITSSSGNINEYATIVMRYTQEARPGTDLKVMDGAFQTGEEFKAQRKMNHNQFNALVEGYDFKITATGKIIRIK